MSYFNIVARTTEDTVVTEYEPVKTRSDSYQSEAELEREFIRLLCEQGYEYLPGRTPAQTSAAESMSPALHGLVLALMNQEAGSFTPTDRELVWEGLYNMLSLYGQLDWRGEAAEDTLLLPAETVNDYAAALNTSLEGLGALPASLEDRLTFEPGKNAFRAVCGEDGLSQIQVDSQEKTAEGLLLTGALVYLPDGSDLVRFQALLQPRDNMLGCAIVELTIFEHG